MRLNISLHFVKFLAQIRFLPETLLLEIYPPFLFMGVRVKSLSKDYTRLHLRLPLRWYGRNINGTMFGGFICAAADPLAALLCLRIFPDTDAWTKTNSVDFIRPAKGPIDMKLEIPPGAIELMGRELQESGTATMTFGFDVTDDRQRVVAHVKNTVFLRKKSKRLASSGSLEQTGDDPAIIPQKKHR